MRINQRPRNIRICLSRSEFSHPAMAGSLTPTCYQLFNCSWMAKLPRHESTRRRVRCSVQRAQSSSNGFLVCRRKGPRQKDDVSPVSLLLRCWTPSLPWPLGGMKLPQSPREFMDASACTQAPPAGCHWPGPSLPCHIQPFASPHALTTQVSSCQPTL